MSWPDDDFATRYRDADDATLDQLEHELHAMLAQIPIIRDQRPRTVVVPTGDRHLPVELWSKIFVLCGPDGSSDWETARHSDSDFPVILSLVSKDWQEIALITSQIWSKIAIIPYSRSFSTKRATLWLSRAKSTPLQIYLHASTLFILSRPLSDKEKERLLLDALDFVAENIHRCERFGIFEDRRDQFIPIMSRLRRPAPILTHFRLELFGFEDVAGVDDAVREEVQPHIDELFANHSPMLSTARLISFAILWPSSALRNLTTLHVASGGPVETARLLGILGNSPALKTASFSAFRLSTEAITHFNTPVTTHRSLQNFTIRCESTADALAILEKLDLPALRSLTVDSSEVSGMADLSNIIDIGQDPSPRPQGRWAIDPPLCPYEEPVGPRNHRFGYHPIYVCNYT